MIYLIILTALIFLKKNQERATFNQIVLEERMAEWKDRYNLGNDLFNHQITVVNMIPVMSNQLKEEQLKDEYCSDFIKSLRNEDQTNKKKGNCTKKDLS